MSYQDPVQTLIESFSALADEVQNLIDRKTILEHKLRFSHEQVRVLSVFFESVCRVTSANIFLSLLRLHLHDEYLLALDLELALLRQPR